MERAHNLNLFGDHVTQIDLFYHLIDLNSLIEETIDSGVIDLTSTQKLYSAGSKSICTDVFPYHQ